jgi:hypothetical protein
MSNSEIEKGLDPEIAKEWAEMEEEIYGTKEDQEKIDAENKKFAKMEYEKSIKAGGVLKVLAEASRMAKSSMESDGLMPTKGEYYGEWTYTSEQGAKAACYAREDAATTLILQAVSLGQLRVIKRLLWGCVALLAYIAYKAH